MLSKTLGAAARLALQPARQNAVARFSTTPANGVNVKFSPVPKPLKAKMESFQIDNNLPVHVRGGPVDKILYGVTAVLCTIGVFDCCRVYFDLSYPKDQQSKLIWGK